MQLISRPELKPDNRYNPYFIPGPDREKVVVITRGESLDNKNAPPQPGVGRILIWEPARDRGPRPLDEQMAPAWYATLSPDNRFVVATEVAGTIRIYDAVTGKPIRSFEGRKLEYCPTLSPDGTLLATVGGDWEIRIYDFATGRVLSRLKVSSLAACIAFSPDGRMLASGHQTMPLWPGRDRAAEPDDSICLWDARTGTKLRSFASGHYQVATVTFSPDGRTLASGGFRGDIRLWEATTGQERRRYEGHIGSVRSVDFDPDGRRLVSAGYDGTVLVWRVFENAPAIR